MKKLKRKAKIFFFMCLYFCAFVFLYLGPVSILFLILSIIPVSIVSYLTLHFLAFNENYFHYDNDGLYYKKYKILYKDIDKVQFIKNLLGYGIRINKTFSKNSFNLIYLFKNDFNDVRSLIESNIDPSTTVISKKYLRGKITLVVILILFILPLLLNPSIEKNGLDFYNPTFERNINSGNYSFYIEGVEYQTQINEYESFIITTKGKIRYFEQFSDDQNSREDLISRLYNYLDFAQIDSWFSNPIGILFGWCKFIFVKYVDPFLIETDDFRGIIQVNDFYPEKYLAIKNKDSDIILRILFSDSYDFNQILEIAKSIEYKENSTPNSGHVP